MKRILLLAALSLFGFGQSHAASQKMGVVDLAKVLFYYDEFKILRIELANRESRYQQELTQEEGEIGKIKQRLMDPAVSEKEKEKLEKDFSRKMFNLQRKFEQYKKNLDKQKEEELEKIKAVVFDEIAKLAKSKRLDYVLDKKQVYYGKAEDFTDQVIERVNKLGSSPKSAKKPVPGYRKK